MKLSLGKKSYGSSYLINSQEGDQKQDDQCTPRHAKASTGHSFKAFAKLP